MKHKFKIKKEHQFKVLEALEDAIANDRELELELDEDGDKPPVVINPGHPGGDGN